ncbi:MAG: hypothetical protein DRH49_07290, partial [Candidatus Coatesbacteria bacterium]
RAEDRRPPGTAYLVNYYQEGVINFWSPWYDGGLDGGPIPGADYEVNLDKDEQTVTHSTIDNNETVQNGIISRLIARITR